MRLNILCEGQTEEAFVNRVLRPHLASFGIFTVAQLIPKRGNSNSRAFKGGWLSYFAVRKALLEWMKSEHRAGVWFTTMLDLYAIPQDYPRLEDARKIGEPRERVAFLEDVLRKNIITDDLWRFTPYLQLHEFEALIFADPAKLNYEYIEHDRQIANLSAVAAEIGDPEMINDSPMTAPSKRILTEIPEYSKVKSGALVADRIGLPILRERCEHFGAWLSELELLPTRDSSEAAFPVTADP